MSFIKSWIKFLLSSFFVFSNVAATKSNASEKKKYNDSDQGKKRGKTPPRVHTYIPIEETLPEADTAEPSNNQILSPQGAVLKDSPFLRSIMDLWVASLPFHNIMLAATNTSRMALLHAMHDKPEKIGAFNVNLVKLGFFMHDPSKKEHLDKMVQIGFDIDLYRIFTSLAWKNIHKAEELEKSIENNAKRFQNLFDELILPFMDNYINKVWLEKMYNESLHVYETMLAKAKIEGKESTLADIKAEMHRNEKNMELAKYKHQIFLVSMHEHFNPAIIDSFMKKCNSLNIGISKIASVHVPFPHSVRRVYLDMQKHRMSSFLCPDIGAGMKLNSTNEFNWNNLKKAHTLDSEAWLKGEGPFKPEFNVSLQFTIAGALRKMLGVDSRTAEILQNEMRLAYRSSINSLEALTAECNVKLATLENLTEVSNMHYQNYQNDKLKYQFGGLNNNRENISIERVHESFRQYMRVIQDLHQARNDLLKTLIKLIKEQGELDAILIKCIKAGEGRYTKIDLRK